MLSIEYSVEHGRMVLTGSFAYNDSRTWNVAFCDALGLTKQDEILLDCNSLTSFDASALGMLLLAKERAYLSKKRLVLENVRGIALEVCRTAKLHMLFEFRYTAELVPLHE